MHAEALAVLEAGSTAGRLRDPLGVREQEARLLLALGRATEAEAAYRRLIATNPENYGYHAGLQAALKLPPAVAGAAAGLLAPSANGSASSEAGQQPQEEQQQQQLSEEQRQRLAEVYAELQQEHPRSAAARRMPLDFLVGPASNAAQQAQPGAVATSRAARACCLCAHAGDWCMMRLLGCVLSRAPSAAMSLTLPPAPPCHALPAGRRRVHGGSGRLRPQVLAARHPVPLLGCEGGGKRGRGGAGHVRGGWGGVGVGGVIQVERAL
jgi:hypothetical protein